MTRGDTQTFVAAVTNPDGTPFNLSGSTVWFSARMAYDAAEYVFQRKTGGAGIVVPDPATDGVAVITTANSDTSGLPATEQKLVWDLQVKTPDDSLFTPDKGPLIISPDVTTEIT